MAKNLLYMAIGAFTGLSILAVVAMFNPLAQQIPPTPAFSKIITGVGEYSADEYNEVLTVPKYAYAQLSDLTTQGCAADGAATNVTINTNNDIYGITHSTISNTHEIKIQSRGTYQIIAVPQVGEASIQADGIHNFWMNKNGEQVPNLNIRTSIFQQIGVTETLPAAQQWVGYLEAGDIIYFQQACTDADIGIIFTPADVAPATPSIIVSVAKLDW